MSATIIKLISRYCRCDRRQCSRRSIERRQYGHAGQHDRRCNRRSGGGQLLTALIPMMAGVGNNVDIGALVARRWGVASQARSSLPSSV